MVLAAPLNPRRALPALALAVVFVSTAAGCVTTGFWPVFHTDDTTREPITKVFAMWDNRVRFALNPLESGKPYPGLAGIMYLYGVQEGFPVLAKGTVVIDVFDISKPGVVERPWRNEIKNADLQKLRSNGFIGQGYALFFDWPLYRPDMTKVKVQLSFVPDGGMPIYADPVELTFQSGGPIEVQSRQVLPGQPYAAKANATP